MSAPSKATTPPAMPAARCVKKRLVPGDLTGAGSRLGASGFAASGFGFAASDVAGAPARGGGAPVAACGGSGRLVSLGRLAFWRLLGRLGIDHRCFEIDGRVWPVAGGTGGARRVLLTGLVLLGVHERSSTLGFGASRRAPTMDGHGDFKTYHGILA